MEAATTNPNSLSQAVINIPAFLKGGRRLSSSVPAFEEQTGEKQTGTGGILSQTPTVLPGVCKGVWKGVFTPKMGASPHARRDDSFATKAPGRELTRPRGPVA